MPIRLAPEDIDLRALLEPGDTVVCGQATAEPSSLSAALMRQAPAIGGVTVFVGPVYSDTFDPARAADIRFTSYGGIGRASRLARAGRLDVVPSHYSQLPDLFRTGALRADVVLLQLGPAMPGRRMSLGLAHDYTVEAARRARVVVAEINAQVPWTHGAELPADLRIDAVVETNAPPLEQQPPPIGDAEQAIGARVGSLIPDGATIQLGIGAIPSAILTALAGHRDLGIHSGMIGDSVAALVEAGVVTNARKTIDRGVTVAGLLIGTNRLYRHAHDNPAISLRPATYTHAAGILGQHRNFFAVNSAVEVDLTGQVNAEVADGVYVGAVGGQLDFIRAANGSAGGRSIIALPATARGGSRSRIVARISSGTVTTPRSDADAIVTEFGLAELKGCSLAERARRLVAIAAPAFQEALDRAAHALTRGADD